jgi:OOP family OmpA-OmpF porin
MMKKYLLLAAVVGLMAGNAQAQGRYEGSQHGEGRWPNWYLGVSGSISYVDETDIQSGNSIAGEAEFENGYGVTGSIGYTPGPTGTLMDYTRFEFEVGHRFNDAEKLSNIGGSVSNLSGEVKTYTYMINTYFDFDTQTQVSPYVGAGIGFGTVSFESASLGVNDDDSVFAYQFMAGLGWQPEFLLNTVLQVGYRYHATSDPSFASGTGQSVETQYSTHALEAGARFRF